MAEHRFYIEGLGSPPAGEAVFEGEVAHRIVDVLRLRPGDHVRVIGGGREFEAILEETGARVRARLLEELPPVNETPTRLTLYQGLIRPNRFEWLIEKCTELGVAAFVPVLTERTAVRAGEIGPARLDRWRRIAVSATEQSGGRQSPEIAAPMAFTDALARAGAGSVVAWEGLKSRPAAEDFACLRAGADDGLSLFIGPEGGFADAEIESARAAGAHLIGLGPRTLRAETAAIVACALLLLGRH